MPHFVSVLLLISGRKLAPAQYTKVFIIWRLHEVFQENKFKTKLMFCKPPFIIHVRLFKVILEYKNEVPRLQKWAWHMHNKIA